MIQPPRLDIEALRAFHCVITEGGVTRAAERLSISQSAVSHRLKRLEDAIGCILIDRRRDDYELSCEGKRLFNYAEKILDLHDEAAASIRRKSISGRLCVGVSSEIANVRILQALARFERIHDTIVVKVVEQESAKLKAMLDQQQLDLMVIDVLDSELATGDEVLWRNTLFWVKSSKHGNLKRAPLRLVTFRANSPVRQWAFDQADLQRLEIITAFEAAGYDSLIRALQAGFGTGLIDGQYMPSGLEEVDWDLPTPPKTTTVLRPSTSGQVDSAVLDEIKSLITETSHSPAL